MHCLVTDRVWLLITRSIYEPRRETTFTIVHILGSLFLALRRSSCDLTVKQFHTFPRSPDHSWGIYYIVGRALLFPVDISPHPVISHNVTAVSTSIQSSNSWPPRFWFSARKRLQSLCDEYPWYTQDQGTFFSHEIIRHLNFSEQAS